MSELQPIVRECRDCTRAFTISVEEQQFFARLAAEKPNFEGRPGWTLPARCSDCRAYRRAARLEIKTVPVSETGWLELDCQDCGSTFRMGPRDVEFFTRNHYSWPKRCKPCREARRQFNARG